MFFSPVWSLIVCFFFCTVICNFRSAICQALVLEIGETVQILEKSEGKLSLILYDNSEGKVKLTFTQGLYR